MVSEKVQDIIKRLGNPDTYELAKQELLDEIQANELERTNLAERVNTLSDQNAKLALRIGGIVEAQKEEKTQAELDKEEAEDIKERLREGIGGML